MAFSLWAFFLKKFIKIIKIIRESVGWKLLFYKYLVTDQNKTTGTKKQHFWNHFLVSITFQCYAFLKPLHLIF